MKLREPFQLTCANCESCFEYTIDSARQTEWKCPQCGFPLTEIRDRFEGTVRDWTYFVEDMERILALESEFKIAISDADAENMRTFADAHDYLVRRLVSMGHADVGAEEIWNRLCSAVATAPEIGAVERPKRSDPFVRTVFAK